MGTVSTDAGFLNHQQDVHLCHKIVVQNQHDMENSAQVLEHFKWEFWMDTPPQKDIIYYKEMNILLMEEILHHNDLYPKPCKYWDKLINLNWWT